MAGYATFTDFEEFLEAFGTNYYGTVAGGTLDGIDITSWQAAIDSSFNRMNTMLDTIDRIPMVPIGTMRTGVYHPALIEWNVSDVIFNKLRARHLPEYGDKLPDWMLQFGSRGKQIFNSILAGDIALDTDTTNRGIGSPISVSTKGVAAFYSNWETGFYRPSDFARTYRIKITGTNDGNLIGQARFQLSYDDGYSYSSDTEALTGTGWNTLDSGLAFRWAPYIGTLGTNLQLELGDTWKITCIPLNINHINSGPSFKQFAVG